MWRGWQVGPRGNGARWSVAWFKRHLPLLQKFEIKYGWKEFEIRINFPYRNFFRFEMKFKLKFREFSMGRT
jgi:hypothetical protein